MKEESFDPTQHKFCYNLTKDTCFQVKTGICSLNLTEAEIHKYSSAENDETSVRGSVNYCVNLFSDLKQNGFKKPIQVASNPCGHYSFTDGQHRTCSRFRRF
ncbi:hypothetical protein SAMN04487897_1782 [Paenibacillus sp. yr247]|nr:hypothetical protein SAMN04487897_1782 [Paenibacillus sp. yr247]